MCKNVFDIMPGCQRNEAELGTEDQDGAEGKVKPGEAGGVEGRSTVECPEVCGAGRVTSDQGDARGTSEPVGALRTMVPNGTMGGRSQGGTNR